MEVEERNVANVIELAPLVNLGDESETISNAAASAPRSTIEDCIFSRRLLYASHFLAQWNDASWSFSLAMLLAAVTRYESFVLVASYGICLGGAVAIASGALGRYIDHRISQQSNQRLATIQSLILIEILAVSLVAAAAFILLTVNSASMDTTNTPPDSGSPLLRELPFITRLPNDLVSTLSLIIIHAFGAIAHVMDQAVLIALERDWIVVMSQSAATATSGTPPETIHTPDHNESSVQGAFEGWLSDTNVTMKQIDLGCKVVAPAVIGAIISYWIESDMSNYSLGSLLVGTSNIVALVVEYCTTAQIYSLIPTLANASSTAHVETLRKEAVIDTEQSISDDINAVTPTQSSIGYQMCTGTLVTRKHGMALYMEQSSAWAGLALALLYMNTLTFGNGILESYLVHHGVGLQLVGILRGIASAIGLLGTLAYHASVQRWSLATTGLWSILFQTSCLGVTVLSLLLHDKFALKLLVGGICVSRIGLWVFDITVTQIQQREIPGNIRSQIGGIQQSLNAFFNLLGFSISMLFPNPDDFQMYVLVGFFSVGLAALLFTGGVYLPRRRA